MAKKSNSRYTIGNGEWAGKPERFVSRSSLDLSSERPNRLYVIRGHQIDSKVLNEPEHPQNTVYLDGASQGPYVDQRRHIYSLDHHANCIRSITLSTCEQALRMTRKRVIGSVGLNIIANEPDLDTVLAGWAILHADRVALDNRFFRRIRPIFSLAGNVDSYGFGHDEFTDLSQESLEENRRRIDWVLENEHEIKEKGNWEKADFLDYTRKAMEKLDELALYDDRISETVRIDAMESIPLSDDKDLVFAISTSGGIYEVEREIRQRERKKKRKCVCILFHDGRTKFTLKLTDFLSEFSLKPAYVKLTSAESDAKLTNGITDQRFLKSGWGGSDGIGGPPRYPNGAGTFLGIDVIKRVMTEELKMQSMEIQKLQTNGNGNSHNGSNGAKPPPDGPKVP